ncbi:PEP-CTERM sorting domain-containing protein [Aquabacterium sp. OR-4]|uniref:PEP-CTERM sorting domain-containing protein n=1 Tax=Aquabacterium sp. OR-4 TaxID=2978127 RepID=UPI0021B2D0C4|nr:PEP-CTERM sorting domain-containing protein [Aquabacterium sp. OR-4]MDT7835685.1 PEP-CTERM sorting domain-containing protein [Aquabacterium sp. OR-4]
MFLRQTLRLTVLAAAALAAASQAQATRLGSNLIVNGDAEAGTSGWTAFDGTAIFGSVAYSSNWVTPSQPGPADRGSRLFVGDGGNAFAAGYQALDVSDLSAQIDLGQVSYSLSGWLGGWTTQNDNALLYVQFFGAGNADLGNAQLGPVMPADRDSATGLVLVGTSGALPTGTTSVVFSLSMERFSGGDNDGYADNLAFQLQAVPEPQTYALMGLGLLAVAAAARRARR